MHIEDLKVKLGKNSVLNGVNADFENGKISVVIGRNGSGKTTLLRCVAGLIKPAEGKITFEDREPKNLEDYSISELSKEITYFPQNLPKPAVTVYDLVAMGLTSKPKEVIDSAILKAGMTGFENRLVCHLSGGERALVFVAMMLARKTKTVVLDEPFASLDVQAVKKVSAILKELASKGVCVVVSVHDISRALELADTVLLVDGGKSVYCGPAELNPQLQEAVEKSFGVAIKTATDTEGQTYFVQK